VDGDYSDFSRATGNPKRHLLRLPNGGS